MDDAVRLRAIAVRLAIDAGVAHGRGVLSEAALIEEFLRTGEVPSRPVAVRLSRGGAVARPQQQGSTAMFEVHRGDRYEWDAALGDAITGTGVAWDRVTTATDVQPPEAGAAFVDTDRNKLVFDPSLDGIGQVNCVVALTVTPKDGGQPVTASEAGAIDPDGITVALSGGGEVPRPAA